MTSSIDSNVWISLWDKDRSNLAARKALDAALLRGPLVVAGAVYAELLGGAARSREMLSELFEDAGIAVDWRMSREIWESAGLAYQVYVERRREGRGGTVPVMPRRMLTDFLIGAHASVHGYSLLTMDKRLYRTAFPRLSLFIA